jgi:hypothetical protein
MATSQSSKVDGATGPPAPGSAPPTAVLAELWRWWAGRCRRLDQHQLDRPTRCERWDVRALLAHVTPDPGQLAAALAHPVPGPAAAIDAADVLRIFNAPGGLAHLMADTIAATAAGAVGQLTTEDAARRFEAAADLATGTTFDPDVAFAYPGVGTISAAALTDLAVVEATVHALDLAAATDGALPPRAARTAALDVLVRVVGDAELLDVLAGRADPGPLLPALR